MKGMCMNDGNKKLVSDALRILHGARSLPPVEAAEALRPFLESMRGKAVGDKLANASTAAVTELDDRFHETGLDEASIHGTGIMFVDSSFEKS
jgi:hypothetical protein